MGITETDINMDYLTAVKYLENGDAISCIDFFKDNNYGLEYAYALVLSGDLEKAQSVLVDLDSVRSDWLLKLIDIFNGMYNIYPSYFQIRNFLEIDVNIFFRANKIDYVNALLRMIDAFQEINGESYKCIARVLLKNNYKKECKIFLDKSADAYYNDVELHYLFVEYYLAINDYENAKKSVEKCIIINPEYYPALKQKELLKL